MNLLLDTYVLNIGDLVNRHHMEKVFETARMYTGQKPGIDTDGIFGVTTFELG